MRAYSLENLFWPGILENLSKVVWEENENDSTQVVRTICIGTIPHLFPSGKYTPDTEEESNVDTEWWEVQEQNAEDHGCTIDTSENDPLNILVTQYANREIP